MLHGVGHLAYRWAGPVPDSSMLPSRCARTFQRFRRIVSVDETHVIRLIKPAAINNDENTAVRGDGET